MHWVGKNIQLAINCCNNPLRQAEHLDINVDSPQSQKDTEITLPIKSAKCNQIDVKCSFIFSK